MNISRWRTRPVGRVCQVQTDLPLIPGFDARGFAGPADFPAMVALINACNEADGADERTTLAEIEVNYRNPDHSDPYTDMVMLERAGRLVAYTRAEWWQETAGPRVAIIWAHVHPAARGGEVIDSLFDWLERRSREIAGDDPAVEKVFEGFADAQTQPEIVAAYEARGYRPITYVADMVRPHLEDVPAWSLPGGVEIRPVAESHLRAIWEADREAFRDHWGASEPTESDYQRFLEDPNRDVSLWKVAWAGDRVVSQVRSFIKPAENQVHGRGRGYTEAISTVRDFRRQGIARSLICASFEELKARGMTEAALGVHTENPNGAFTLYEDLGFAVTHMSLVFRKPS